MQRRRLVQGAVRLALAARRAHGVVDVGLGHLDCSFALERRQVGLFHYPGDSYRRQSPAASMLLNAMRDSTADGPAPPSGRDQGKDMPA